MDCVITNKSRVENQEQIFEKVCSFLEMPMPDLIETEFVRQFRELCLIKLFYAIGVGNKYNGKNRFFGFVSLVLGQAVSDVLNLGITIAPDYLRLIKYDGINFVNQIKQFLQTEDLENAMIDAFDLCDDNVQTINSIDFEI